MMVFGRRSDPPTVDSLPTVASASPGRAERVVRIPAHDTETSGRIGKGSRVRGTLHFQGGVSVYGEVEGEIFAGEAVIVRRGARVTATIRAKEVVVEGNVQARVYAERLEIGATGRLLGDVVVGQIVIHEGAIFEGACGLAPAAVGEAPAAEEVEPRAQPGEAVSLAS
jgi:cytoskeletal protein CcmA (bactofilin family)